jgi:hypothetical protein
MSWDAQRVGRGAWPDRSLCHVASPEVYTKQALHARETEADGKGRLHDQHVAGRILGYDNDSSIFGPFVLQIYLLPVFYQDFSQMVRKTACKCEIDEKIRCAI